MHDRLVLLDEAMEGVVGGCAVEGCLFHNGTTYIGDISNSQEVAIHYQVINCMESL